MKIPMSHYSSNIMEKHYLAPLQICKEIAEKEKKNVWNTLTVCVVLKNTTVLLAPLGIT